MQKHLSPDIEALEACDRALIARHRDMPHALSGLVAETRRDQFIVAPHGAVEEHQGGAGETRFEIVGHPPAGGEEIEIFAALLVQDPESERIARAFAAGRMRLAFEIPRALAGNLEGQDIDARW